MFGQFNVENQIQQQAQQTSSSQPLLTKLYWLDVDSFNFPPNASRICSHKTKRLCRLLERRLLDGTVPPPPI